MRPQSLIDIPAWSQLRDPLPDGREDPFRAADCGEECAAMRIYYRTGIELPAGVVRSLIPHHSDHGETTASDLVGVMRLFGLSPQAVPARTTALRPGIERAIKSQTPPIVLGTWLASDTLHWVLGVGASADGLTYNDPWSGTQKAASWDWVLQRYTGWAIL